MKHLTKPIRAIHFIVLAFLMTIGTKGSTQQISLSNEDDIGFARSCFVVAKNHMNIKRWTENNQFSYWPSEVLEINSSGADIETKVRIGYKFETGGNNGWGTVEVKEKFYNFTCLFSGVARGEYPAPVGFINTKDKRTVWVAFSGRTCEFVTNKNCQPIIGYENSSDDGEGEHCEFVTNEICQPYSGYRNLSADGEGESSYYSTTGGNYWEAYGYEKVANHFRNNR